MRLILSSAVVLPAALIVLVAAGTTSCDSFRLEGIPNPSVAGSAEPHLAPTPDGRVVMSWLEPDGENTAVRYSVLEDGKFGEPITIASGDNFFVNWADFPSVVPLDEQLWAAHWLVQQPDSFYAYDVAIAVSKDAGKTWSTPLTPHTDGTATEHGFVDLFPVQNGVGAVWLDGRNMAVEASDEESDSADANAPEAPPPDGMTLRSALVSTDGALISEDLVDPLVCDCCQTDVAISSRGPVLVYRNRTEDEIRDIYVAVMLDGVWQPGKPVADDGWEIDGCPVNGPAVAATGLHVAAAWFTMAGDVPKVRFARSRDGGATFETAIDIDSGTPVGRVDVVLLDSGEAVVSWLRDAEPGQAQFMINRVSLEGALGQPEVIAFAGSEEPPGFPQMVSAGGRLVFAWTESLENNSSQVRTAEAPIR